MKKCDKKICYTVYAVLLVEILLMVLLFAYKASPLYNVFGGDPLEYKLGGAAVIDGLTIFKDIFHQKGSLFFFIEALGELICRWFNNEVIGTFIIESVNMLAAATIMYFSSAYCLGGYGFSNNKRYAFSFVIVNICILFWLTRALGGNNNEEYSLLYNIIAIAIALEYANRLDNEKPYAKAEFKPLYAFFIGVCFAVSVSIRFTNAAVIGGVIIFIGIILIKNKSVKVIFKCIGFGFVGILIVILPQLVYYYLNDALEEMLYQSFIFNFQYLRNYEMVSSVESNSIRYALVCYALIIGSFLLSIAAFIVSKKKHITGLSISLSLINMIMYLSTSISLSHYMLLQIPVLFVLMIAASTVNHKKLYTLFLSIALCVFGLYFSKTYYQFYNDYNSRVKPECTQLIQQTDSFYDDVYYLIEDDKKNDMLFLMDFNDAIYGYYHFQRYPFSPYFSVRFFAVQGQSKYVDAFYDDYEAKPPKYIVASNEYIKSDEDNLYYQPVINDLADRYSLSYTDGVYSFYTLK
ncbi:MAG: hypothetical protein ACI4RR_00625 [Eubacterium sp.]